jgi:hypothetical protein
MIRNMRLAGCLAAMALMVMLFSAGASAGTYMKQVIHSDPMEMGGTQIPGSDDTATIWMDKAGACWVNAKMIIIYRTDKEMIYMLDPATKTYNEISMAAMKEMTSGARSIADSVKRASGDSIPMNIADMMKISVTPTSEKKVIGKWKATKYILTMNLPFGTSKTEVWATEDIKIDMTTYNTISNAMMAFMPGFEKMMEELKKIKGVNVFTVTASEAMGGKARQTSEVVECVEKPTPAGIFEIPAGYTKAEQEEMSPLQKDIPGQH